MFESYKEVIRHQRMIGIVVMPHIREKFYKEARENARDKARAKRARYELNPHLRNNH